MIINNKFKGVVKLTSDQYQELKTVGYIIIDGKKYEYDPYSTLYMTDSMVNAVLYTPQELTEEQKLQARTNIGAGTSNFSGSYNDLTDKPEVGEPIAEAIRDNATQIINSNNDNLLLLGGATGETGIAIGKGADTKEGYYKDGGVAIGLNAKNNWHGVAIGNNTTVTNYGAAVGYNAQSGGGVAIGEKAIERGGSISGYPGVAIGNNADSYSNSAIAIGDKASGTAYDTIAIGRGAQATKAFAIQLGRGTNNLENTLQIRNDVLYNFDTHTLTAQNIKQNGNDVYSVLQGETDPTEATVGAVGQFYISTATDPASLWLCTKVETVDSTTTYTWTKQGGKQLYNHNLNLRFNVEYAAYNGTLSIALETETPITDLQVLYKRLNELGYTTDQNQYPITTTGYTNFVVGVNIISRTDENYVPRFHYVKLDKNTKSLNIDDTKVTILTDCNLSYGVVASATLVSDTVVAL